MNLALQTVREIFPKAKQEWLGTLTAELAHCNVFTTPNEYASFLAQIDHESSGLTIFEENLNYSAERMAQVWPRFAANPDEQDWRKRVPNDLAKSFNRNPEALANYIYDDKNRPAKYALGNIYPGDGWRFHGRGPIQGTGRRFYERCGTAIGADLIAHPELLLVPVYGVRSSIWFWLDNDIDKLDEDDDVRLETRKINGGDTGLEHRQALFNRCLEIIKKGYTA